MFCKNANSSSLWLTWTVREFWFGWEQNVCSNQYSLPQNISSVSLILSYTSNMEPVLCSPVCQGAKGSCVSQLKSKPQTCEWGPGCLRNMKPFISECFLPPTLPLAVLWPHQSPESKGDLGVSPGLTWDSLLQSAKSQKHHLCEMEALCVCHKGCHCPQSLFHRDFPTSQEPRRAKIIC